MAIQGTGYSHSVFLLTRSLPEHRTSRGIAHYQRIERRGTLALRPVNKASSPAIRWARRSRLTALAHRRFNALSARGEARVQRWLDRGALEEERSRALLNDTVTKVTNDSLDRHRQPPRSLARQDCQDSCHLCLGCVSQHPVPEKYHTGERGYRGWGHSGESAPRKLEATRLPP